MMTRTGVAFSLGLFLTFAAGQAATAQEPAAIVAGTASIAGPDGQPSVLPGVTITLTCERAEPRTEVSNGRGEFRFPGNGVTGAGTATCSIAADLQGFKSVAKAVVLTPGETVVVTMVLGLDTLREEVVVSAQTDAVESPITAHLERMTAHVMRTAPIASERFQDALPLIPGVVRGPDGLLNISGTRSNQSALTFNSANGTDPVTGEDAVELPIDAVSSVQVRGAAYAPEFGLSAGAVTTVETQKAGDSWHLTLNDLEPRVRRRGGAFKGIESFTPRVTIGGPVVNGKLSVLQSMQYEYSQTRVFGLPPFESDTKLQSFESFSRADWTVSPANHFTGSAIVSPRKTSYAGLNTFNPQGVTPDVENHNLLGSGTDQIILGSRGVLETRVSVKQFDSMIYPSHGRAAMVLAPDVNSGSYFNDQDRTSRRAEWLSTYSFTPLGPRHLVKLGAGVTHETFEGVSTSRPVEIVRENGTPSQEITFAGGGLLGRSRTAAQGYAQDSWTATSRLTVQFGARYDYESITGDIDLAPRGSFTAVVPGDGRTVVRGGAGMFYNSIPLNVAAFTQLQSRRVTHYAPDGETPLGPAVQVPNVVPSGLRTPRSANWNIEVDREWLKDFFVRAGYQQRENRFESVVDRIGLRDGISSIAAGGATALLAAGRSRYREGQISARYGFHGTDQIIGSYTRSSASGDLNDFNSFFGNIENPIIPPDARGPLPWDAPNRLLFWSSISLPRGFAVFPVLDVRTGFPLSNVDGDRNFVGPRNEAGRYPAFVSLDTQVTKRLRVFRHNATVGLKIFNITDHFNPRDYQGNLASAGFGGFNNSVGRTFRGKWVFEF
jgi:TonB dependent receptor